MKSILGYLGLVVVLAACSPSAPATGNLQINITGLPAGANANVVVTKPDSTTQNFTASGSISNTPVGSYAIGVNDVTNAGFSFKGTVTASTVTVTEGATSSVTVSHQTTASPLALNITGLPAGATANVEINGPDGFKQTVTQTSSVLSNLKSGLYSFKLNPVKPDSATFTNDDSPTSLILDTSGGNVTLRYKCTAVNAPDASLDFLLRSFTGKASYTCTDLEKLTRLETSPSQPGSIVNLEGLQYATGLTTLNLGEFSKITALPVPIFDKLTKLTNLNLNGNRIASLSAGIFDKLTNLTVLSLGANQMTSVPAGIFDKPTNLTNLNLSGNQISSLPAGVFEKLTNLNTLNLGSNQISSVPAGVFNNLTKLNTLTLSGNTLSELPTSLIDKLPTLGLLGMDSNCFATEQNPVKAHLSKLKAAATLLKANNPKAGCPQKTISIASIKANLLSGSNPTPRTDPETDTIFFKISIDGVAQSDLGIGDQIIKQNQTIDINQTLFVNSSLNIEIRKKLPAPEASIGIADLTIDNTYTPGVNKFSLLESDAFYVLTLDQK